MNSIEKTKLYQWASDSSETPIQKRIFSRPSKSAVTYFTDFSKPPALEEYEIHTASDIRIMMDKHFDNCLTEIKDDCLISMLKNNRAVKEYKTEEKKEENDLPEYIYNF